MGQVKSEFIEGLFEQQATPLVKYLTARFKNVDEAKEVAQQSLLTIEAALYELPSKCRQAFVMRRQNNLSYSMIAEQLGVSTSMVEKYIIQALKHFRNKLEQ